MFLKAKADISKILETNTFARFKKSPNERAAFADSLFKQLESTSSEGAITRDDYLDWATNNDEATMFYKHLVNIKLLQSKLAEKQSNQQPDAQFRADAIKRRSGCINHCSEDDSF
jgi:hypothetical protein